MEKIEQMKELSGIFKLLANNIEVIVHAAKTMQTLEENIKVLVAENMVNTHVLELMNKEIKSLKEQKHQCNCKK